MRTRTWLVLGLSFALAGATSAQPAAKRPAKGAKHRPGKVDLAPAIAALGGTDLEAAAKAAETLGESADPAAHDALLDALAMGLPPAVATVALGALAQHPAPPDVTALKRYAGHHTPSVRSAAIGALALYPDPVARKAVVAGLHDMVGTVRSTAAASAAKARIREAVEPLFALLERGEESAGKALAAMADVDLARKIGDHLGKVPDGILADTLGMVLRRADFGPDAARVEIVRAIGKIQDTQAVSVLTDYLDATPKNPPRQSREEAQKMVEARLGGGQ
jgi:HEAT repeat protein